MGSKYATYGNGLKKALRKSAAIICRKYDDDSDIYVSNGIFTVKLQGFEYDKLVRPVVQCDYGNWLFDDNGFTEAVQEFDLRKDLENAAKAATNDVVRIPLLAECYTENGEESIVSIYYCWDKDFVVVVNKDYTSFIEKGSCIKGSSQESPIVFFDRTRCMHLGSGIEFSYHPFAMVSPVVPRGRERIVRAVKAWTGISNKAAN